MSHPYDMGEKKSRSILGPTLKFKGELTANEDLVIQGRINGSINHTSNLTIGTEGKLKADVKAEHITIEGEVDGDLEGNSSVVVKDTANVTGNIYSPTVTLHEGSKFNGRIDMSGNAKPNVDAKEENVDAPDVAESRSSNEKPKVKIREAKKRTAQSKRSAGAA